MLSRFEQFLKKFSALEKPSSLRFFFLCELDGHIEDLKVQKSLEELGLHCEDFHVLGVFEADKLREKNN